MMFVVFYEDVIRRFGVILFIFISKKIYAKVIREELQNVKFESDDLKKESDISIDSNEKMDEVINKIHELSLRVETLEQKTDNNVEIIKNDETKVEWDEKKTKAAWLKEVAFYVFLVLIVFGAFLIKSNSEGRPTSFAGFSAFTVLTSSMEREIPRGSLVITKDVPAKELKIGDDITYMANETTTITHRIIAIYESYQDTGKRAFETKGIMNEKPDKNLVPETNVVGKVIFHSEILGIMAGFVSKNWPIIVFAIVIIIVFIAFMKNLSKTDVNETKEKEITPKKKNLLLSLKVKKKFADKKRKEKANGKQ